MTALTLVVDFTILVPVEGIAHLCLKFTLLALKMIKTE